MKILQRDEQKEAQNLFSMIQKDKDEQEHRFELQRQVLLMHTFNTTHISAVVHGTFLLQCVLSKSTFIRDVGLHLLQEMEKRYDNQLDSTARGQRKDVEKFEKRQREEYANNLKKLKANQVIVYIYIYANNLKNLKSSQVVVEFPVSREVFLLLRVRQ